MYVVVVVVDVFVEAELAHMLLGVSLAMNP